MCLNRTYTIVAPKVLRPSLDYHVSISLHGGAALTNLVVAIEGQQDGGGQVRNAQSATVEPNSTQVIKFQVFLYMIKEKKSHNLTPPLLVFS